MIPRLNAILSKQRQKAVYLRDHAVGFSIFKSFTFLLIILIAHAFLMTLFEGLSWGDAAWLTLTTATTVGYGDISATTTAGRWTTALLLYCGGIFVLANFAGEYLEARNERKSRKIKGQWSWNMKNHIVIINTPAHGGDRFSKMLITQIRNDSNYADIPIQIMTRQYPNALPRELRDLGVIHYHGAPDVDESFKMVNITHAKHIIVLSKNEHESISDALSYDIIARLADLDLDKNKVIVECVEDGNRARFHRLGFNTVIRPIRAYPEVLVRTLVAPGSEQLLEDLFTHSGAHPRRYPVEINNTSWADIVVRIMQAGLGTAMSYINQEGEAITNPSPNSQVTTRALIIMVNADTLPNDQDIKHCLQSAIEAIQLSSDHSTGR